MRAQHLLLTQGLGVNHLRFIMGTSMGCMHAWVWGTRYPGFADAADQEGFREVAAAFRAIETGG